MIGLHRARTTGAGCDIDVSLLDTAISMLNYLAIWTLNRDWRPQRLPEGAHQSLVPSQSFRTRDGWSSSCMKEKFWGGWRADGLDPCAPTRWASAPAREPRCAASDPVRRVRAPHDGGMDRPPAGPRADRARLLRRGGARGRAGPGAEMVVEIAHPVFGRIRGRAARQELDGVRPRYAPAARLEADTDLLSEAASTPPALARLRADGVV
jgi:hypothetical protein